MLLRLLGEATSQQGVTVRIGHENQVEGLTSTSVVTVGYGLGERYKLFCLGNEVGFASEFNQVSGATVDTCDNQTIAGGASFALGYTL